MRGRAETRERSLRRCATRLTPRTREQEEELSEVLEKRKWSEPRFYWVAPLAKMLRDKADGDYAATDDDY